QICYLWKESRKASHLLWKVIFVHHASVFSFSLCVCPANTSLSVFVDTRAVLHCPNATSNVLVVTWSVIFRDNTSCIRAYRTDSNKTREKTCTDERISWDSRPDQNFALRINPVAITHEGYYKCEVVTPDGNFCHGHHLQVLVPPKVTLSLGENGTTVCWAVAGKPAAQISWTPMGDCHTVEERLGNDTVTVQSTCHWEDRQVSEVSCFVSHVTGNKSLSIELNQGNYLCFFFFFFFFLR
uniref:Ig-like domain-containing protein n=1 Tax=Canis lupus dingo TaxID=286419 RepID=A0A8C0K2C2_CANLU